MSQFFTSNPTSPIADCISRARLYHIIQYEDDNGDMLEDEVECDLEDTMQKCGIEAGAKLVIKVDSEEYDDDE